MYIDIITYKRNLEISDDDFKSACADIHNIWMKTQEGFIGWDIGSYTGDQTGIDLVYWKSEEDAKKAQENMANIPANHPWLTVYNMSSVSSKSLTTLHSFN